MLTAPRASVQPLGTLGRWFSRPHAQEPACDPPHRRVHLRGRRPLGVVGAPLPPCCPSPTSSWSPRPAAGPCCCPRRAAPRGARRRGRRGGRRPRRPGAHRRGRRRPPRLRRGARARGGRRRPDPRRQRARPPRRRPRGPTCPCSPSAAAARCSTSSSAAPCTSTCPTWWATWRTAARPTCSATSRSRPCRAPSRPPRLRGVAHGAAARTTRPSATSAAAWWPPPPPPTASSRRSSSPRARFVLGVQWHPEEGMDQRPFDALVEAAAAYAEGAAGAPHARDRPRCAAAGSPSSPGPAAAWARAWPCTSRRRACTSGCAPGTAGLAARTRPRRTPGTVVRRAPVLAAVDVTDRDALARFADDVVDAFGRIDLWVNNAGLLGPHRSAGRRRRGRLARTVDVNVNGSLHGSAVFAAHVRSRPGPGVLVNISSGAATKPYVGLGRLLRVQGGGGPAHPRGGARGGAARPARLRPVAGPGGHRHAGRHPGRRRAAFPEVERFRRAAAEHQFNSPAWVAEHILSLAFGPGQQRSDRSSVRVPDQPVSGPAG